ncbi:MAG: AraC family transcriptional regulator [Myxococcales bacterium]
MSEGQSARGFFRPLRALSSILDFGLVLPDYRYRNGQQVQRVPNARTTLYYAADVRRNSSARTATGLFCEGPHSKSFGTLGECGEMVAVKVRAGGLGALLGVPAKEVRDSTLSLTEIWGRDADLIAERMAEAPSTRERVTIFQQELARRVQRGLGYDPVAVAASNLIEQSGGRLRVSEIIERSGYSQRALLQKFDQGVGLTPKQQARVARIRATIARMADPSVLDWAELAVRSGYADQAHMIHEFRDLVGHPPVKFIERRQAFSPIGADASGQSALPGREQKLYQMLGMVSRWVGT